MERMWVTHRWEVDKNKVEELDELERHRLERHSNRSLFLNVSLLFKVLRLLFLPVDYAYTHLSALVSSLFDALPTSLSPSLASPEATNVLEKA